MACTRFFAKHIPLFTFLVISLALILSAIISAPAFFTYADHPIRAEAIVLFSGVDDEPRYQSADRLLEDGCGSIIIVPAHGNILTKNKGGGLVPGETLNLEETQIYNDSVLQALPRYYEATHKEALLAKLMLDRLGMKSANFVSSPYHMKRIKLIVEKVFNAEHYRFAFVPSGDEKAEKRFWLFNRTDRHWVVSEAVKILWFLMYGPFYQPAH